jgi:hypothetical protein
LEQLLNDLDSRSLREIADPFRGTRPSGPPRPADYETDLFWSVYVVTGFEPAPERDQDPDPQTGALGLTDGDQRQMSIVFFEAIRDGAASRQLTLPPAAEIRRRTTVHEIGHQFHLAADLPAAAGHHRENPANIMMAAESIRIPGDQFYFAAADIVALRRRIHSPDGRQP